MAGETVSVHLVRGQYGWTFSQGVDALTIRLRQVPKVLATVWNHSAQQSMVAQIRHERDMRIAIVGYSLGARDAPQSARLAGRDIDLLIGIDPSRWSLTPVPDNVKKAICFYNAQPGFSLAYWLMGAGAAKYTGGDQVENLPAYGQVHLGMDWDQQIWARVISEVTALAH